MFFLFTVTFATSPGTPSGAILAGAAGPAPAPRRRFGRFCTAVAGAVSNLASRTRSNPSLEAPIPSQAPEFAEVVQATRSAPTPITGLTASSASEVLTRVTVRRDAAAEAGYGITWMRDRDDLPVRVTEDDVDNRYDGLRTDMRIMRIEREGRTYQPINTQAQYRAAVGDRVADAGWTLFLAEPEPAPYERAEQEASERQARVRRLADMMLRQAGVDADFVEAAAGGGPRTVQIGLTRVHIQRADGTRTHVLVPHAPRAVAAPEGSVPRLSDGAPRPTLVAALDSSSEEEDEPLTEVTIRRGALGDPDAPAHWALPLSCGYDINTAILNPHAPVTVTAMGEPGSADRYLRPDLTEGMQIMRITRGGQTYAPINTEPQYHEAVGSRVPDATWTLHLAEPNRNVMLVPQAVSEHPNFSLAAQMFTEMGLSVSAPNAQQELESLIAALPVADSGPQPLPSPQRLTLKAKNVTEKTLRSDDPEVANGEACVFCVEDFKAGDVVHTTGCGHVFHGECPTDSDLGLSHWHGSCPSCREVAPPNGLERHLCPEGHTLVKVNGKPAGYRGTAFCDVCNKGHVHREAGPPSTLPSVWHCAECQYDKCETCGPCATAATPEPIVEVAAAAPAAGAHDRIAISPARYGTMTAVPAPAAPSAEQRRQVRADAAESRLAGQQTPDNSLEVEEVQVDVL